MNQPPTVAMRVFPLLAVLVATGAHAQHPRLVTTAPSQDSVAITSPLHDTTEAIADAHTEPADQVPSGQHHASMPATPPVHQPYQPATPLQVGDATRNLIRLQASGQSAAPQLPMLGHASSAAYQRYLKSFTHNIPEFFDTTVSSTGSTGSR